MDEHYNTISLQNIQINNDISRGYMQSLSQEETGYGISFYHTRSLEPNTRTPSGTINFSRTPDVLDYSSLYPTYPIRIKPTSHP